MQKKFRLLKFSQGYFLEYVTIQKDLEKGALGGRKGDQNELLRGGLLGPYIEGDQMGVGERLGGLFRGLLLGPLAYIVP